MLVEASDATSEALDRAETADVAETAEAAFEDWIDDCWDCYTWFYTKAKSCITSDLCELVKEASEPSSSSACMPGATFFMARLKALSTASVW